MKIHARPALLWVLLVSIWLVGCATTPPAAFYTLAPLPAAAKGLGTPLSQSPAVGVGPIGFPAFLDRAQLVGRSGVSLLTVDEPNRWGGSLQDDFTRVLGENLAHLLGTSRVLPHTSEIRHALDFRLVADVLRFEGTKKGEAMLKVRWAILNPYTDEALLVREGGYHARGSRRQRSGSRGRGHEPGPRRDFSREVSDAIRRLPRPKRPPAVEAF